MAGERDVLAEALRNTIRKSDNGYISVYWVESPKFADAILAALAARGWRLVPSAPEGAEPLPREALAELRTPPPLFEDGRPNPNGYEGGWHDAIEEVLARLSPDRPTPP